jgi:hypothetical protein
VNGRLMLKVRWLNVGSSPLALPTARGYGLKRAHNAREAAAGLALTPPPRFKLTRLRAATATCCPHHPLIRLIV